LKSFAENILPLPDQETFHLRTRMFCTYLEEKRREGKGRGKKRKEAFPIKTFYDVVVLVLSHTYFCSMHPFCNRQTDLSSLMILPTKAFLATHLY